MKVWPVMDRDDLTEFLRVHDPDGTVRRSVRDRVAAARSYCRRKVMRSTFDYRLRGFMEAYPWARRDEAESYLIDRRAAGEIQAQQAKNRNDEYMRRLIGNE